MKSTTTIATPFVDFKIQVRMCEFSDPASVIGEKMRRVELFADSERCHNGAPLVEGGNLGFFRVATTRHTSKI